MNRQIFQGDVLEQLAKFPDCSVDCIISSPPYWGLRDYGTGKWVGGDPKCDHSAIRHKTREERGGLSEVQSGNQGGFGDENKWTSDNCPTCGAIREDNQLGLEPDFHDYLNKMQTIMDELKRVLKNTGTCWINLGDTYSGSGKGAGTENCKESWRPNKKPELNETITAKSRMGIPERFYINCIDGGWIARNHIVWTKNNSMPTSVKDRFKNAWESVFFFSKNKKYYFDLDAVRVPTITNTKPFNARVRDSKKQRYLQKATDEEIANHNEKGEKFDKKWNQHKKEVYGNDDTKDRRSRVLAFMDTKDPNYVNPKGKNPGDVFRINTKPFKEAHFATFPPDLPQKILKCACPNQVCKECGKPREVLKKSIKNNDRLSHTEQAEINKKRGMVDQTQRTRWVGGDAPVLDYEIIGYADCGCNAGFKPGIVLDPFFGSGTVGLVAEQMGLRWCGIELNPEYIEIAKKRLAPYTSVQKMEAFV